MCDIYKFVHNTYIIILKDHTRIISIRVHLRASANYRPLDLKENIIIAQFSTFAKEPRWDQRKGSTQRKKLTQKSCRNKKHKTNKNTSVVACKQLKLNKTMFKLRQFDRQEKADLEIKKEVVVIDGTTWVQTAKTMKQFKKSTQTISTKIVEDNQL